MPVGKQSFCVHICLLYHFRGSYLYLTIGEPACRHHCIWGEAGLSAGSGVTGRAWLSHQLQVARGDSGFVLEGSKLLAAAANGEKIQLDGDLRLLSGWHGYIHQEEGISWSMHQ